MGTIVEEELHVGTIERRGALGPLYFTPWRAADDPTPAETWRVWDRWFERAPRGSPPPALCKPAGRWQKKNPPSSYATTRVFVPKEKEDWKRVYTFTKRETRELSPSRLLAQLKAASFLAKDIPDTRARSPR